MYSTEKKYDQFIKLWSIPSSPIYLAGDPNNPEIKAMMEEDVRKTKLARENWQPGPEAIKYAVELNKECGNFFLVQYYYWEVVMEISEGYDPFACQLKRVYTDYLQDGNKKFLQLFIEVENPVSIFKNYSQGSAIDKGNVSKEEGSYIYNCGNIMWLTSLDLQKSIPYKVNTIIPTEVLKSELLPQPVIDKQKLMSFAATFDGYAYAGGLHELFEFSNPLYSNFNKTRKLPDGLSIDDCRACLYLQFREEHWQTNSADLKFMTELLKRIQQLLIERNK